MTARPPEGPAAAPAGPRPRPYDTTDVASGAFLILVALFFGWQTTGLELGTSLRMGPGYFPMVLSALLFVMGVLVLGKALRGPTIAGPETDTTGTGTIAWRGILFILPTPIFFGLTVRGLGFVPALFLATLIASQASMRMKPLAALVLALLVTVFSTLVFSYALGLPFRRFGPWLPF